MKTAKMLGQALVMKKKVQKITINGGSKTSKSMP